MYVARAGSIGPCRNALYKLLEAMMADELLTGLDDEAYDSEALYTLALGMHRAAEVQARHAAALASRGHVWLVKAEAKGFPTCTRQ